jgi:hypothetical protein
LAPRSGFLENVAQAGLDGRLGYPEYGSDARNAAHLDDREQDPKFRGCQLEVPGDRFRWRRTVNRGTVRKHDRNRAVRFPCLLPHPRGQRQNVRDVARAVARRQWHSNAFATHGPVACAGCSKNVEQRLVCERFDGAEPAVRSAQHVSLGRHGIGAHTRTRES